MWFPSEWCVSLDPNCKLSAGERRSECVPESIGEPFRLHPPIHIALRVTDMLFQSSR